LADLLPEMSSSSALLLLLLLVACSSTLAQDGDDGSDGAEDVSLLRAVTPAPHAPHPSCAPPVTDWVESLKEGFKKAAGASFVPSPDAGTLTDTRFFPCKTFFHFRAKPFFHFRAKPFFLFAQKVRLTKSSFKQKVRLFVHTFVRTYVLFNIFVDFLSLTSCVLLFVSDLKVTVTTDGGFPLMLEWKSEMGGLISVKMEDALGCSAGEAKPIKSAAAEPLVHKSRTTVETTPRAHARRTTPCPAPPATTPCPAAAAAPSPAGPSPAGPSPAGPSPAGPSPAATPVDWATLLPTILSGIIGGAAAMAALMAQCLSKERGQTTKARKALNTVMWTVSQLDRDLNVSYCYSLTTERS
jgi:hypothetical protein